MEIWVLRTKLTWMEDSNSWNLVDKSSMLLVATVRKNGKLKEKAKDIMLVMISLMVERRRDKDLIDRYL